MAIWDHLNADKTPQSEPVPGKDMVPNSAGGFAFALDDWARLDRFLILGSEGGTYYANERKLTLDNADALKRAIAADGVRAVSRIAEISESGRAPKNTPAILALALCAEVGDGATKTAAYRAVNRVCRTGTHLFEFAAAKKSLGGAFGAGMRRAVGRWYTGKSADQLAYQVVKYRNRAGMTHRDLLRLARPDGTPQTDAILCWCVRGPEGLGDVTKQPGRDSELAARVYGATGELPPLIVAFDELQAESASRRRIERRRRDSCGDPGQIAVGGVAVGSAEFAGGLGRAVAAVADDRAGPQPRHDDPRGHFGAEVRRHQTGLRTARGR